MLTNLIIKNFVLIEHIQLSLGHKLTVLTGETGSGKSILLDAVSFALGARSDTNIIPKGEESSSVIATFEINKSHPAIKTLLENEILSASTLTQTNEIIIRRTLTKDGKNKIFINDIPTTLNLVKSIGDFLVEIHGQFDNQSLLNPITHINILDTFGELHTQKSTTKTAHEIWQKKLNEYKRIEEEFLTAKQDEDYLKHNLDELIKLNPIENEEEELDQKRHTLQNSEKIITIVRDVHTILSQQGDAPEKPILNASYNLNRIPDEAKNENIKNIISELELSGQNLSDAYERLGQILESENTDTLTLEETEERLFKIRELARKHKITPNDLPTFTQSLKQIVENINNSDTVLNEKKKEVEEAKSNYLNLATDLSNLRNHHSEILTTKVMAELAPLKLEKATFKVVVTPSSDEKNFTPHGIDSVYFMGQTNIGGNLNYIHKIASGGELARFTLAIKVVISGINSISSMIFDEVDTGISGATASAVGERLAKLSKSLQTLVVTHSAQVASHGNHHFKVEKSYDEEKQKTITIIDHLTDTQRVMEIARIISGENITPEAIHAATSLLNTSTKS